MDEASFETEASLNEQPSDLSAEARHTYGLGYCGGCGSWDAHGRECLSCGYDFQSIPIRSVQS